MEEEKVVGLSIAACKTLMTKVAKHYRRIDDVWAVQMDADFQTPDGKDGKAGDWLLDEGFAVYKVVKSSDFEHLFVPYRKRNGKSKSTADGQKP